MIAVDGRLGVSGRVEIVSSIIDPVMGLLAQSAHRNILVIPSIVGLIVTERELPVRRSDAAFIALGWLCVAIM